MSVSYISDVTRQILWGKAAGRCEYRGCNKPLFIDDVTKAQFNSSYIAHIIADKASGPRGDVTLSPLLKADISNLMLMCDAHHRQIDKVDVTGHPVDALKKMKAEHETRIELITNIGTNMASHIVTYKANVGEHTPAVTYEAVRESILPERYPALPRAIDLSLHNSYQKDLADAFWVAELDNLESQFNAQLLPLLRRSEVMHISLFALAPMPLLIKLGTLINDIANITIHQPVRSPKGWKLAEDGELANYTVSSSSEKKGVVALNLSLSASIDNDRIHKTLGPDCEIYHVTIPTPFNDFLKNKDQLSEFSRIIRLLFDQIKLKYGAASVLHVFPAMPVATAIEFGRVWMPKADMPLCIYDQQNAHGGFVKALEIR